VSLLKATSGLFENYTFVARPEREFASSSSGVTGAIRLFPQASTSEKMDPEAMARRTASVVSGSGISLPFDDGGFGTTESEFISEKVQGTATNVSDTAELYLTGVEQFSTDPRQRKTLEIVRSTPPLFLTSSEDITNGTFEFNTLRRVLFPHYATAYPSAYWGYANYFSLNFLSGATFPSDAALIYANPTGVAGAPLLTPSGAFTLETYVKPTCRVSGTYPAGTLFHVSSSFALSIVSGSGVDAYGRPSTFRLLLQLSHSADIPPSSIDLSAANNSRTYPQDLVFLSEDGITFNGWHHAAVRWGGSSVDSGTGSFFIDGARAGDFCVPSSSVTRTDYSPENSNALFIGNYYEGTNNSSNAIKGFFGALTSASEGFTAPFATPGFYPTFTMRHQLGAELHEVRFWSEYRSAESIVSGTTAGYATGSTSLFYLGPHFIHESPDRDVPLTPFRFVPSSSIDTPFARQLSLGLGGHMINTENHLRELVTGYYPRHLNMTASQVVSAPAGMTTNDIFFATEPVARKNLLVIPCDNGKFFPRWANLTTSSLTPHYRFGNPGFVDVSNLATGSGGIDPSVRKLEETNLLDSIATTNVTSSADYAGNLSLELPAYVLTANNSSYLASLFDASNLFYGSKIHPGTFELSDPSFTGSAGLLSVRLRDNGMGGLYRADCTTPHAKWNSVGTLLYEEGLAIVTSPYFGDLFGKDAFSAKFRGEQPITVLSTNVTVPAFQINSSSLPSYIPLTASNYANEDGNPVTYITRVNLHDENLNIVAKAELAQPIAKRLSDKFVIKVKFDF
jgi:hypothetical protein